MNKDFLSALRRRNEAKAPFVIPLGKLAVKSHRRRLVVPLEKVPSSSQAQLPPQAVSRVIASWYLAAVLAITSGGRCGDGGVLSQGLPLMRTASSQSRTNCLS